MNSGMCGRDTNNSFDFALYDDRVVTDVFTQPGRYFGRKNSQPAEVAKYLSFYTLIEHSSHMAALMDDRVVLASETAKRHLTTPFQCRLLTEGSAFPRS